MLNGLYQKIQYIEGVRSHLIYFSKDKEENTVRCNDDIEYYGVLITNTQDITLSQNSIIIAEVSYI